METVSDVIDKAKGARGRKDADKQEAVTKPEVVAKKLKNLIELYKVAQSASTDFSDAVKATGEASGYNTKAVRSLVVAKAGESFEEKKRNVDQQYKLFSENEE